MFYKNYMERRMDCDRQLQKKKKTQKRQTLNHVLFKLWGRGVSNSEGISKNMEGSVIKLIKNKIERKNDQSKMHFFPWQIGICRELYKVI